MYLGERKKTGSWHEEQGSGLEGNFERAFVRLSGAFGRTWDTQVGNGKEFPTEQPNICYGPL